MPRFQGNLDEQHGAGRGAGEGRQGERRDAAQAAIAWVAARGDDIVPLIGARTRARLDEALGATRLDLAPADLAEIEAAMPADQVAGTRYDAAQIAHLDSER